MDEFSAGIDLPDDEDYLDEDDEWVTDFDDDNDLDQFDLGSYAGALR
ncbi:MAG: hypothetical protein ACM31P_11160 [Actinomycetota bacterium]